MGKADKREKHTFLAFDIGASSGRSIIGVWENESLETRELTRFSNPITEVHGKYYWNIFSIYQSMIDALTECSKQGIRLTSIGIDTWGVDFVCIAADGTLLGLPRSYRDPYTDGKAKEFFSKTGPREVYEITGIQTLPFNSLFQLYAAGYENYIPLKHASHILFMPDALNYLLCGKKACEYTIASTSQFLNACTRRIDIGLLEKAGIPANLFPEVVMPGTTLGTLTPKIACTSGAGDVPVIAVAGHDTACAVAAVPSEHKNFAYLSSGTWSLMGIETEEPILSEEAFCHNFTNEGGIEGTIRFLRNISGMWLLEECKKEWEKQGSSYKWDELVQMAKEAEPFLCFIQPDDSLFCNPDSMMGALEQYCYKTGQELPAGHGQIVRVLLESLAMRYSEVFGLLKSLAPFSIETLHIIGGGSQNELLNQFTANAINTRVVAGPQEATALGNLMIQAKVAGLVKDRREMRKIIARNTPKKVFIPQEQEVWQQAYEKYLALTQNMEPIKENI